MESPAKGGLVGLVASVFTEKKAFFERRVASLAALGGPYVRQAKTTRVGLGD
jgi:hypothetical protein